MLCQDVKDEERNRQIKRILMQNSKSSNTISGNSAGDEGAERKAPQGRGHWKRINGGVSCEAGRRALQGEIQHVQRHRNTKRAVTVVGWHIIEYGCSISCVGAKGECVWSWGEVFCSVLGFYAVEGMI